MKKLFLSLLIAAGILGMSSCENYKGFGNMMITGSMTYYYALVYSKITENRYYHIQGWTEYGPDGAYMGDGGKLGNYVGIELHLVNGDVIYRYNQNYPTNYLNNLITLMQQPTEL